MGIRQHWRVVVLVSVLGCAVTLPGLAGWPVPDQIRDVTVLILTAILISAVAKRSSTAEDRGMMPLSFIVEFGALLLMGGNEALVVAAAGITTRWLVGSERARPPRTLLLNAASILVAMECAALVYGALFGLPALLTWPWQAVPIAAAVVAYCIVKSISVEVIAPLLNRSAISRSWPPAVLHHYPNYFIGASLAVGLVEIVSRGAWELLPVAAVPLYCAYRVQCAEVNRFEDEFRRREVIASLTQGMAVIDGAGRLVLWNDALEHAQPASASHPGRGDDPNGSDGRRTWTPVKRGRACARGQGASGGRGGDAVVA